MTKLAHSAPSAGTGTVTIEAPVTNTNRTITLPDSTGVLATEAKAIADSIAQFTQSLSTNGWQRLPSGLIIQWGSPNMTGTSVAVTFPIAFPNACLALSAMDFGSSGVIGASAAPTATGVTFTAPTSVGAFFYIAIGH